MNLDADTLKKIQANRMQQHKKGQYTMTMLRLSRKYKGNFNFIINELI